MNRKALGIGFAALAALSIGIAGCGSSGGEQKATTSGGDLSGKITIDGSSTVFPISQAVAEEFMNANVSVDVTVGESGTGGGFKKFVRGEVDITNASRPIEPGEDEECKKNGVEYIEIPVAFDGLTVVVNPKNQFVDTLTVAELKEIWKAGSTVTNWSQVRPGFPNRPIKLYGPGTDSGTFEYFTEAVIEKKKASRSDYTASEDDNVLVQGVAGDENALGYFGFSYYVNNKDKLKAVKIDGGTGPVEPTIESVNTGQYAPLSRPIFIYVNKKAIERPEMKAFLEFYLTEGPKLVEEVQYVALPAEAYDIAKKHVAEGKTGSVFMGETAKGLSIADVMKRETE